MKMNFRICLVAAFVGLCASGQTQNSEGPPPPPPLRIDFEFDGGLLGDLLKKLDRVAPSQVNVITDHWASEAYVPPFKLYDFVVEDIVPALSYNVTAPPIEVELTQPGVWIISSPSAREEERRKASKVFRQRSVSQIGHLLSTFSVDDISTAIQISWELGGDTDAATMKFHSETGLLLAYGTKEQLMVIEDVVENLELGLRHRERAGVESAEASDASAR